MTARPYRVSKVKKTGYWRTKLRGVVIRYSPTLDEALDAINTNRTRK